MKNYQVKVSNQPINESLNSLYILSELYPSSVFYVYHNAKMYQPQEFDLLLQKIQELVKLIPFTTKEVVYKAAVYMAKDAIEVNELIEKLYDCFLCDEKNK